jgi:hypothetical protein
MSFPTFGGAKLKNHVLALTKRWRKIWRQMDLLEEHARRETETIRSVDPEASEVPYNSRETWRIPRKSVRYRIRFLK